MRKIINVIRWMGVATFIVAAIASILSGSFIAAVLFLLGGFLIAPLNFVRNIREKIKLNKTVSIIVAVMLFFFGGSFLPSENEGASVPPSETITQDDTMSQEDSLGKSDNVNGTFDGDNKTQDEELVAGEGVTITEENPPEEKPEPQSSTTKPSTTTKLNISTTAKPTTTTKKPTTTTTKKVTTTTKKPTTTTKTPSPDVSQIVYIATKSGEKYHSKESCRYLKNAIEIKSLSLSDAKSQGYTACSACH